MFKKIKEMRKEHKTVKNIKNTVKRTVEEEIKELNNEKKIIHNETQGLIKKFMAETDASNCKELIEKIKKNAARTYEIKMYIAELKGKLKEI